MTRDVFQRGLLTIAAALALLAAILVAFWVIPAVQTDPLATPDMAVPAFWTNAIANTLVALGILTAIFFLLGPARTLTLGIATAAALVLAVFLLDAAAAFSTDGPSMDTTTTLILVCAFADVAAGALVIAGGILRRISKTHTPPGHGLSAGGKLR